MKEYALSLLEKKDRIHTIDMRESIVRGTANVVIAGDDAVLLNNPEARCYMLYSENVQAAARALKEVIAPAAITTHNEFETKLLTDSLELKEENIMRVHTCAYFKTEPVDYDKTADIRLFKSDMAEFMFEHYHNAGSIDYINGIIENENAFGIYVEGKPAGFIGFHNEGSIGLLQILPEYRRRNLATTLEAYITNVALSRGYVPYCQVVCDNTASLNLQRKLGYEVSSEVAAWVFVD